MLSLATSIAQTAGAFFDATGRFFDDLASVHWGALIIGLAFFALNLTLRARAWLHTLRAAYPGQPIAWQRIWGGYVAAVGFNSIVPARGGDVIKLFLVKSSVPRSSYSAVASSFAVESIFDVFVGFWVLVFAFTQGVFPKPPAFAKLSSFDIAYFASNFRVTLFLVTLVAVLVLTGFAILSRRVRAFWDRVRLGFTILGDRRRYLREVVSLQVGAWFCRAVAFWLLLDAFRVGGSVRNVLLVFGVQAVAGSVPLIPGGAGVQQALLVKVFASAAAGDVVAAYSVGQQIAIAAFTAGLGFFALVVVFQLRSFSEVIHMGRAERAAENAAFADANAGPRAPRARE